MYILEFFFLMFFCCGCSGYMPPEYLEDGHYSTKSDVFSFGILALEIVSGQKNWGYHHPGYDIGLVGYVSILSPGYGYYFTFLNWLHKSFTLC